MSLCCQIYPASVPEDWGPGHGQHHWWAAWKSLEEPCRWDTAWNFHTHPVFPRSIWRPKALPAPKISETKHTFKNFGQPVNSWIFPIDEIIKYLIFISSMNVFICSWKSCPAHRAFGSQFLLLWETTYASFQGWPGRLGVSFCTVSETPTSGGHAPGRAVDEAGRGNWWREGGRLVCDPESLISDVSWQVLTMISYVGNPSDVVKIVGIGWERTKSHLKKKTTHKNYHACFDSIKTMIICKWD